MGSHKVLKQCQLIGTYFLQWSWYFIDMGAQTQGLHDPWCTDGGPIKQNRDEEDGHPLWNEEEDGDPLQFMAELLRNWPGETPTVDLDDEKRHLRFIQIVAGYPEIVSQMYPLDWPTHPDSIKAFRLSLFLDSLPVPHSDVSSIHSVRSAILFLDHKLYSYGAEVKIGEKLIKNCQKQCLTILFQSIRKYKYPDIEFPDIKPLEVHEAIFLNNLHSMDNDRIKKWLDEWETYSITRNSKDLFESKHYHTFKFRKIQTWINNWADPPFAKQKISEEPKYPLSAKVRHNILSGTSVLLECFFAQLRRHILAKYRPGSIIIDGGGRITFYAKKDKVEQEIMELLENSFVARPPTHPYHYIITQTLEQFGKGKICQVCPKVPNNKIKECLHGAQFPQWEWNKEFVVPKTKSGVVECKRCKKKGDYCYQHPHPLIKDKDKEGYTPKQPAYLRFLHNNELSQRFFPPISFKPLCEEELPPTKPLDSNCPLCNEAIGPCKVKNSATEIENICLLHLLTFNIGKSHKRRDFSIRKRGTFDPDVNEIHSSAAIDINALGYHFTRELPKPIEQSLLENNFDLKRDKDFKDGKFEKIEKIIKDNISQILDLNNPLDDMSLGNLQKGFNRYSTSIRGLRSIFRSRKSFQFNAKWWLSLSNIIDPEIDNQKETSSLGEIGAWIAAGDDLLLVRRGKKEKPNNRLEDIIRLLDKRLKEKFPNSSPEVSFCAGIENRYNNKGEMEIFEMIQKSKENEETCKHRWKTRAEDMGKPELVNKSVNSSTGTTPEKKKFIHIPEGHSSVSSIVSLGEGPESSMFLKSNSEEEE